MLSRSPSIGAKDSSHGLSLSLSLTKSKRINRGCDAIRYNVMRCSPNAMLCCAALDCGGVGLCELCGAGWGGVGWGGAGEMR